MRKQQLPVSSAFRPPRPVMSCPLRLAATLRVGPTRLLRQPVQADDDGHGLGTTARLQLSARRPACQRDCGVHGIPTRARAGLLGVRDESAHLCCRAARLAPSPRTQRDASVGEVCRKGRSAGTSRTPARRAPAQETTCCLEPVAGAPCTCMLGRDAADLGWPSSREVTAAWVLVTCAAVQPRPLSLVRRGACRSCEEHLLLSGLWRL